MFFHTETEAKTNLFLLMLTVSDGRHEEDRSEEEKDKSEEEKESREETEQSAVSFPKFFSLPIPSLYLAASVFTSSSSVDPAVCAVTAMALAWSSVLCFVKQFTMLL